VELRPALAAAFLAVALAACGSAAAAPESSTSTTAAPGGLTLKSGGTVTVAVPSLPTEFNPATPAGSNPVTAMVMQQVWPQPFVVGSGMRVVTGPGLLASAELVGVTPQTVVYTLAKNARWSDGVPISVADFLYDWHEFVSEGPLLPASFPLAGYAAISSIRATKQNGVTVVFKTPYADWQALFENLVPAHIAERYGWAAAFAGPDPKNLVSGGPFIVSKVIPGQELVLSRNPHYWARRARLDSIIFKVERSASDVLADLASGSVDLAQLTPTSAVRSTVSQSGVLDVVNDLSPTLWQLDFNLADPTTSSLDVRLAIANLINRPQLVADSVGLYTPTAFAASSHLFGSGVPGHRRNDGPYRGSSLSIADQLLQSAGYSLNGNGILDSQTGIPLTLTLTGPAANPLVSRVEDELQAQLLQAGITLQIRNVTTAALLDTVLPRGEYELALAPYELSRFPSTQEGLYTDPVGPTPAVPIGPTGTPPTGTAAASLYSAGSESEPSADTAGVVTRNVLGLNDPDIAALFPRAASDLNFLSSSNLYNDVDSQLWGEMVALPLFQQPVSVVYRDDLVNVSYASTWAGALWNASQWGIQINPPPTTTSTVPGS
jgi:peptide/nickel transport system substrate-binding protein